MTEPARLSVANLDKAFAAPVLQGVNLTVAPGEIHAIVGENGAGKQHLSTSLPEMSTKIAGNCCLTVKTMNPRNRVIRIAQASLVPRRN